MRSSTFSSDPLRQRRARWTLATAATALVLVCAVLQATGRPGIVSAGWVETNALGKPDSLASEPTFRDLSYGPHPRQRMDLWLADGVGPRPLVVHIHGGGWTTGDNRLPWKDLDSFLEQGISVARIDYRLAPEHPLPAPLHDVARAVQFLRANAETWHLDPDRFAAFGRSAGGTTALWLAMHDDLAVPDADDPVARESTRLLAVGCANGPTSIEPNQVESWLGPLPLQSPMFRDALGGSQSSGQGNDRFAAIYRECSPIRHVDAGDPPVLLLYRREDTLPPADVDHAIHHPVFGVKFKEKADSVGLECHLYVGESIIPGTLVQVRDFLIEKLLAH